MAGRRGFTLVELLLAGMITAFVLGAVTMSLSQLSKARSSSKRQLEAYLRADSALTAVRRDIVSVIRDPDLFRTRLLLTDDVASTPIGHLDRDEIVLFTTQLQPTHEIDFSGEGMEFETQYRIDEDAAGPVLWQRRDAVPDEYPLGGGVATPLVPGVVSLSMEAYDGEIWLPDWDSDYDGLPLAVRVTVIASGHRDGEDPFDAPLAILRTVVPIDRVPLPAEPPAPPETQAPDDTTDQGGLESPQGGGVDSGGGFGSGGDFGSGGSGGGSSGVGRRDTSGGGNSSVRGGGN